MWMNRRIKGSNSDIDRHENETTLDICVVRTEILHIMCISNKVWYHAYAVAVCSIIWCIQSIYKYCLNKLYNNK